MHKVDEDGIQVGKGGPGIHIEAQLLLKVTAKADLCAKREEEDRSAFLASLTALMFIAQLQTGRSLRLSLIFQAFRGCD